jgi:hypothetical protein
VAELARGRRATCGSLRVPAGRAAWWGASGDGTPPHSPAREVEDARIEHRLEFARGQRADREAEGDPDGGDERDTPGERPRVLDRRRRRDYRDEDGRDRGSERPEYERELLDAYDNGRFGRDGRSVGAGFSGAEVESA